MGKELVTKLKSSKVSKTEKETETTASGLSPSEIKREHQDPDDILDDHTAKRIKTSADMPSLNLIPLAEISNKLVVSASRPKTPRKARKTTITPRHPDHAVLAMSILKVRLTILKHLPVSSLLQFALVCKDWYGETRSVLEKFKTSTAFISGHQPCVDLVHLNNEIPWMTRIPFNGLNIKVFRDHQPCVSSDRKFEVEKFLGNVLKLPLKSLEINRNQWMDSHCLASALLREAFRGRFPTIEKMIFPLLPPMGSCPREEDIFNEKSLLNLKYLECSMFRSSSKPLFLLALQVAPNIQEILTPLEVSSSKNEINTLTRNQLKFVKWLLLEPVTSVRPSVVRFAKYSCSLRRLEVMEPVGDMRTDNGLTITVNQLLECSRSTLDYLSVANHELVLSLDRTVKPFPSLKYFQISIASMTDQLPAILSRFCLGQMFPNLICLRIFFSLLSEQQAVDLETTMDTLQGFYNDGDSSQLWPPLTRLEFHVSPARSFSYGIFDHFAQKCPQITEFVYHGLGDEFLNHQIFTCFPQLKRLKLIVTANHVTNLDEFLCGLDTEDVKELTELPVVKLKQSHVVSRRHSINNLTDLKHFKLVIHEADKLADSQSKQSVLSHVTGVLVFSRWPSLKVEINCHLDDMRYLRCEALYPLSPFAKVNEIIRIVS